MADQSSKKVWGTGTVNEPARYEFKWQCRECGHKWKRVITTDDPSSVVDPACPACKKAKKRQEHFTAFDPASGKAPSVGGSLMTRAKDDAAEMIMKDHGLTDIRGPTEARMGEPTAPKLAPHLQRQADMMFSPRQQMERVAGPRGGQMAGMIARQAMAGGMANPAGYDPAAAAQAPRKKVSEVANIMNLDADNAHSTRG